MAVEIRIGARRDAAVGADLDARLVCVQEGQLRQPLRLVPRDDDEAPLHPVGPPEHPTGMAHAPPPWGGRTVRQDVERGNDKSTFPTETAPGLIAVPWGTSAASGFRLWWR